MSQSAERVRGRAGAPASFGRPEEPEQDDLKVRGGTAIHVTIHADVVPDPASLERLHEAIRKTTADAVLAGYADAFAEMERLDEIAAAPEQEPGSGG